MLLNFLVRSCLLVVAPLKEFAEDPSVFTVTIACAFTIIFSHVSRKVFAGRHCRSNLPRTGSTVPVQRLSPGEASVDHSRFSMTESCTRRC